jgi:hypothetical protein
MQEEKILENNAKTPTYGHIPTGSNPAGHTMKNRAMKRFARLFIWLDPNLTPIEFFSYCAARLDML